MNFNNHELGKGVNVTQKEFRPNLWTWNFIVRCIATLFLFSSCLGEEFFEIENSYGIIIEAPSSSNQTTLSAQYELQINTRNQMHKVTKWGHDIKQEGKVYNLTATAAQKIFQNGNFNLLRIPFYCLAHNADGSVKEDYLILLDDTNRQDNTTRWKKITSEGDWFYLKNIQYNKYLKGYDNDYLEIAPTSFNGPWTQWKLVDTGNGWYHLLNRGLNKYIKGLSDTTLELVDTSNTEDYVKWKLIDDGNGNYYIDSKGHNSYLRGDGNAYEPIIEAINIAKVNGDPELLASHKIYGYDNSTYNNRNYGPFYTTGNLDPVGFASAIDAFLDYIELHTGKTIQYLAPRCELGNDWTTSEFISVVNNLTNTTSIVGPEAAYAINSENWWSSVQSVVDIKSTHNKEGASNWPIGAEFQWNGETIGGNGSEFYEFFNELNQSFYRGKVSGVVFWGDTHLLAPGVNETGDFRHELLDASAYNLVECNSPDITDPASAIAFETNVANQFKVFYSIEVGTQATLRFNFDGIIDATTLPLGAYEIQTNSFLLDVTSSPAYGSFDITVDEPSNAIKLASVNNQCDEALWEVIPSEGEWFYLRNVAFNYYMRGLDTDVLQMDDISNTGPWTQWRLVNAGGGWSHIESRGHNKYIRALSDDNIELIDTSSTGSWTQWKLVDDGNGHNYIQSKGFLSKQLQGGN
jgi:hypothetical protein